MEKARGGKGLKPDKDFEENFRAGTLVLHLDPEKLAFYEVTGKNGCSKALKKGGHNSGA